MAYTKAHFKTNSVERSSCLSPGLDGLRHPNTWQCGLYYKFHLKTILVAKTVKWEHKLNETFNRTAILTESRDFLKSVNS
jgi:hypothetical protein